MSKHINGAYDVNKIMAINSETDLHVLNDYLQEAIDDEDYEEASIIRDRIKQIEEGA